MEAAMTSSKIPRVIPGDSLNSELVTWEAPEVDGERELSPEELAAELEAIREQAREQGYREGHAAGLEVASQEVAARLDALETALDALARPLERLDHRVEEELLALVQAVTQQLVRREMRSDPGEVVAVIRACLEALPVNCEEVVVRLHPEDARLVRELLQPEPDEAAWRIQADPLIERGGCRVVTASSQIDGRLQTRLGRIIASMLEDERSDERPVDE
ncbi:MAG: flagellar assembly protein FliH [Gammaproteobacteria bacterium]|nr:MAG: flagellar assembly protein FliH [Gammaproteobacteria bacterium]